MIFYINLNSSKTFKMEHEHQMSAGQIIRYSMLKLIFELIGTMFLTILFNCGAVKMFAV